VRFLIQGSSPGGANAAGPERGRRQCKGEDVAAAADDGDGAGAVVGAASVRAAVQDGECAGPLPHRQERGQGQFGTTYQCVGKADGAEYACKSIPKRKLLCREDYEDVYREIQIMHHLSEHPNVVRIRGAYEDALFVHIVMELCAGGELFDRIVAKGHYSERAAAKLIKTIVGVVEGCHSLGVMHRDLKPENFLFASTAEEAPLKATDFGLSIYSYQSSLVCPMLGPSTVAKIFWPV